MGAMTCSGPFRGPAFIAHFLALALALAQVRAAGSSRRCAFYDSRMQRIAERASSAAACAATGEPAEA